MLAGAEARAAAERLIRAAAGEGGVGEGSRGGRGFNVSVSNFDCVVRRDAQFRSRRPSARLQVSALQLRADALRKNLQIFHRSRCGEC
jgi:hypothetical protein